MASQRLTDSLRNSIANRVVFETFKGRKEELRRRESVIANRVVDHAIGDANLKLMNQLPAEYFNGRNAISVMSKEDSSVSLATGATRRFPAFLQYSALELPATNGMWKEIRAVLAERNAIAGGEDELRKKAMALLGGVQTVKRLLEVWPEVEQFLPKQGEQTANLPAVRAEDLNAMIRQFGKQ